MKSHFKVKWLNWTPVVLAVYHTGGGQRRVCARQAFLVSIKLHPARQLPERGVPYSKCPRNFDLEMSEIIYISSPHVSTGSRMDNRAELETLLTSYSISFVICLKPDGPPIYHLNAEPPGNVLLWVGPEPIPLSAPHRQSLW